MHERDLQAEQAFARFLVDQVGTRLEKRRERLPHVVDLVRDVVHPGASLGEESPDRRVLAERPQQLDPPAAEPHRGGFDALVRNRRPVLELRAEEALIRRDRRVEVVDRDAEVMDAAGLHFRRCYPGGAP